MLIKPPTRKQLNVFVFGLDLILLFFSWKAYRDYNFNVSLFLIAIAFFLLIFYLLNQKLVVKFYTLWMRVASIIGMTVTAILMIIVFYFVFSPIGILLRLFRKDILHLRKNQNFKTYWIDKPRKEFDKSSYEKQF